MNSTTMHSVSKAYAAADPYKKCINYTCVKIKYSVQVYFMY